MRILQFASVFIITRYDTIFSLYLIIWLFLTGLLTDTNAIFYAALVIGLPSAFSTFLVLYFGNIRSNAFLSMTPKWFIPAPTVTYSIEYLISFAFFFLFSLHIRIVQKKRQIELELKNSKKHRFSMSPDEIFKRTQQKNVNLFEVVLAFLMKNSYILSLGAVYLIGLTSVNILNSILMMFFIVFFINSSYAKKYWIYLVLYIYCDILLRYIWNLSIWSQPKSDDAINILEIIGITDESISKNSVAYWVLFFFTILQYDAYRSRIFNEYSMVRKLLFLFIKTYYLEFY